LAEVENDSKIEHTAKGSEKDASTIYGSLKSLYISTKIRQVLFILRKSF